MQNKKGKPVVTPEMQKFGEGLGIDMLKFNAIGTPSVTGMVSHVETIEPSENTQQQANSSLRDTQEENLTDVAETPIDGTQDTAGTTVKQPGKRQTEGTGMPSIDNYDDDDDITDMSFNRVVDKYKDEPDDKRFWHGFVVEHYLNCIFGRSGVGKSTICVCVAEEFGLAYPERKALWIDCENAPKLFAKRATKDNDRHYFPQNCRRIQPRGDIFTCIENKMKKYNPALVILDNISSVCGRLEEEESALRVAIRLKELIENRDCTMLVIAHTPKLPETIELEQYSLGGSNKLHNTMENIVAVAKCHDLPDSIYVKHVKCRAGDAVFSGNSVAIADRVVKDGLLSLVFRTNPDGSLLESPEYPHLKKTLTRIQEEEDNEHIAELVREGLTTKQISEQLGIPERTLYRKKKKLERHNNS